MVLIFPPLFSISNVASSLVSFSSVPVNTNVFPNLPELMTNIKKITTDDEDDLLDDVSDWLSDEYGFCHFGFELVN